MKLTFLGTAAGVATRTQSSSSILLCHENHSLLIDCGEPASATLLRLGMKPDDLDAVVLTHLHADHTAGFTQLMQIFQILRRQKDLTVFMPEEGISVFQQLLNTVYLYPSILPFKVNWKALREGELFSAGCFRLSCHANEHLACFRPIAVANGCPAPCESFSLAVECAGGRIVFSGDLKFPCELIPLLEIPCSVLVSELVHFPPEKLLEIPPELFPEKIIFTHYLLDSQERPRHESCPFFSQMSSTITFAKDLQEFVL